MRFEEGRRVAKKSAFLLALLATVKVLVGYISGSLALLTDGLHSYLDVLGSVAVFIGLKLMEKKPNERFPYGYYKAENFIAFLISVLLFATSLSVMAESLFSTSSELKFFGIALVVAAASMIVSYYNHLSLRKVAKKLKSQSMEVESKHQLFDVISTGLVFFAVVTSYFGFYLVDRLVGLALGVLILWTSLNMAKQSVLVLLDVCMNPEYVTKIKLIGKKMKGVLGVDEVRIRRSGPYLFVEATLKVPEAVNVEKAHRLAHEFERLVKEELKEVERVFVHVEPGRKKVKKVAIPVKGKSMDTEVNDRFAASPYFALVKFGARTSVSFIKNPAAKVKTGKGVIVARTLIKEGVDAVVVKRIGDAAYHFFKDNMVDVYKFEGKKLRDAIDLLKTGTLKEYVLRE